MCTRNNNFSNRSQKGKLIVFAQAITQGLFGSDGGEETLGSANETLTNRPGNIPSQRDGTALTLPLYTKEIAGDVWMHQSNGEQSVTQIISCFDQN